MRQVPELSFEYDSNKLTDHYKQAFLQVLSVLSQLIGAKDYSYAFQQSLLSQIAYILMNLNQQNKQWVEEYITKYYMEGAAQVLAEVGAYNSLDEARRGVQFSMINRHMLDAHISDTYNDLLAVTKNTDERIKRLVRQAVSQSIRAKALQHLGRKTMEKEITQELTKQGLSKTLSTDGWVGIVDSAGRRWNLTTYVSMVTRTKLSQAHVEGVRAEAKQRGIDTAIISSRGSDDSCGYFEGMVISLNGLTPGLYTYDQLRKSNLIFHPNCQHTVSPIRDIKLLPPQLREKHERQMERAGAVLEQGRRKAG